MRLLHLLLGVFVITACVFAVANSQQPCGASVILTMSGINRILSQSIPKLLDEIRGLSIPDVHDSTKIDIIGKVSYDLTAITLNDFSLSAVKVNAASAGELSIEILGVATHISMRWHFKEHRFPSISASGKATAKFSDSQISVLVAVSAKDGKPVVKATRANVKLNNFSVTISGGVFGWLVNLIEGLFRGKIRDEIQSAVSGAIITAVNSDVAKALEELELVQSIDKTAEVDFSLCSQPVFTPSYLALQTKGEFYWKEKPSECPEKASPLPNSPLTSHMIEISLSDFAANSASYTYYSAGEFEYIFTADQVPASSPIQLNTTSLRYLLPSLYTKFPNMAMQLDIYAAKYPTAKITPQGIAVDLVGMIGAQVINPANKTVITAFTLAVTVKTAGEVTVTPDSEAMNNLVVHGNLQYVNFTMSLADSQIGPLDVSLLNTVVSSLIQYGVVPYLNQYLANGFPIPTIPQVAITNPLVMYNNGFITIAADVDYVPKAKRVQLKMGL